MRARAWWALPLILAAGCQGDLPVRDGDPQAGFAAVLVRGRILLPSGETGRGRMALNLESADERYLIPFVPGVTTLYVVEPGTYKIHPTRGPFGVTESYLSVMIEHRLYKVPFPRDILRRDQIAVKATKVVSLGVLEARLIQEPGERRGRVEVRLDDSVETRRKLVEEKISHMLNPRVARDLRENAVLWTRALDQALVQLQEEKDYDPAFKRAAP